MIAIEFTGAGKIDDDPNAAVSDPPDGHMR